MQTYESLQGCTEIAPELPGKHKKSQLGPSPNTRETKKKRTPRKEEAIIEALTGPSPDEKMTVENSH